MLRKAKKRRDSGTRSKVQKGPIRDAKHLDRVRRLNCRGCHAPGPSEAHHIRECYPRTMGVRVGDDKVIPLCPLCHRSIHETGRWATPDVARADAAAYYAETLRLREALQPRSPA